MDDRHVGLAGLGARLWRDWTWVPLAAYTLPAFVMGIFDENHHPALPVLMMAATLATAAGAALYLRAGTSLRHGLGLLAGLAGLTVIGGYAEFTWDFRAYYGLPPAPNSPWLDVVRWTILFCLWTTVPLGPAFASLWRPVPAGGEAGA